MKSPAKKKWVMAVGVPLLATGLALTACGDDGDDDGAGGSDGGGSGGTASGGSAGTATAGNLGIQHARDNTAPTARGGASAR